MALLNLKVDNAGVCPEFDFLIEDDIDTVTSDEGSAVFGVARVAVAEPRRFGLRWELGTEGQYQLVKRLFAQAGKVRPMNYIPPDETAIVEVRFIDDLEVQRRSAVHYSIAFDVEEVL